MPRPFGFKHTKETRYKMSKNHKGMEGKHHSEETKKKLSKMMTIVLKGHKSWNKGKKFPPLSKKTKEKISQSRKGKRTGANHPNWKGGRIIKDGYIYIYKLEHPFRNRHNYVYEHRYIIEKYLNRYLTSQEHCHHINNDKQDNSLENLILFKSNSAHQKFEQGSFINNDDIIFDGRKLK